ESLHRRILTVVAETVGERVEMIRGGTGCHPHLRVATLLPACGKVALDRAAEPLEQLKLVVADARVGNDEDFCPLAERAERDCMHSGVFAGHRDRTHDERVRPNRDLPMGGYTNSTSPLVGEQPGQEVDLTGHRLPPSCIRRTRPSVGSRALVPPKSEL